MPAPTPDPKSTPRAAVAWHQRLVMASLTAALSYHLIAWGGFMWRNPTANQMSFYRHPVAIWKWDKLPQYQP